MKTKSKKLLAFVIAGLMAIMMMASVTNAASNYAPVAGTSMTFKKYLVIPSDMAVPDLTFSFTIASGSKVDGDATHNSIYAGNDSSKVSVISDSTSDIISSISITDVSFANGDSTIAGAATDGITNDTTKKYVVKEVTVDFSAIQFSEPGVYRYIITENNPNNGAAYDTVARTLDVNIIDDPDNPGTLKVSDCVMYYGEITNEAQPTDKAGTGYKNGAETDIEEGNKCDGFVNSFPSHNLYVGKKISGNQASKDKYFRFTVTFRNAPAGSVLHVDRDNCTEIIDSNVNGATDILTSDLAEGETSYTNPSIITIGADGTATAVIYLQGNQYVNIMGLPKNATYEVAEDSYAADGYTTVAADTTNFTIGSGDDAITFKDALSGTVGENDIKTGCTNTKQGAIPTGVILSAAGLIIVGLFVVAGVIFFAIRSKRRYEED